MHTHCTRICASVEQRLSLSSKGGGLSDSAAKARRGARLFRARTSAPFPLCTAPLPALLPVLGSKHTKRVLHASKPSQAGSSSSSHPRQVVKGTLHPFHFYAIHSAEERRINKIKADSPSRSHSCKLSRLRSLIIPSQGLRGLLMLCAKPGTSISAPEEERNKVPLWMLLMVRCRWFGAVPTGLLRGVREY